MVSELVNHLGSYPKGVLRPVVRRNKDVAFFEKGLIVTSRVVTYKKA